MYSHLMVPVDDSSLSAANVDAAVQLTQRLGARISFFHAAGDLAATEEGDLLRLIAPEEFTEAARGDTLAVLARAAASAGARGVPCDSMSRVCDRPAEAIVQAAQERGCDLIVMASRGVRQGPAGWLHNSQTERVLRQSPVALLVTRVAINNPPSASERALGVVLEEHRSIAAVLLGMHDLVEPAADGTPPDLASLETMLAYLQAFPMKLHHPKEEAFLHRLMRQRWPACELLLEQIEAQHAHEYTLVDAVQQSLGAARAGDATMTPALRQHVRALVDAVLQHLQLEEREILLLAQQHLQERDWQEMAAAFESNNDPGFGELPAAEFRRLFTRIANLMPASAHTRP